MHTDVVVLLREGISRAVHEATFKIESLILHMPEAVHGLEMAYSSASLRSNVVDSLIDQIEVKGDPDSNSPCIYDALIHREARVHVLEMIILDLEVGCDDVIDGLGLKVLAVVYPHIVAAVAQLGSHFTGHCIA